MGRLVHKGEQLVDAEEAASILHCARRTVTRMISRGELKKLTFPPVNKAWFRLKDVELLSPAETSLRRTVYPDWLKNWHPDLF